MTSAHPRERVSSRMGVCRLPPEDPDLYLGEFSDEASFSFDDGDAYTEGEGSMPVAWG